MLTQVSAETIDAGLYVLPRGTLPSKILAMLRQARKARRPRAQGINLRGQRSTMTLMTTRPPDVATRRVPGHWDGDLIKGGPQWVSHPHAAGADHTPGYPLQDGPDRCHECAQGLHQETPARAHAAAQNRDR